MAAVRELPDLVREFIDLSKTYLRQETLEPAKTLGRFAGFAIGGAVLFALGALFVSIAGMRLLLDALPDSMNWSAIGCVGPELFALEPFLLGKDGPIEPNGVNAKLWRQTMGLED